MAKKQTVSEPADEITQDQAADVAAQSDAAPDAPAQDEAPAQQAAPAPVSSDEPWPYGVRLRPE